MASPEFKHDPHLRPEPGCDEATQFNSSGVVSLQASGTGGTNGTPAVLLPERDVPRDEHAGEAAPFEWLAAYDETDEPIFIHDKEFRILRCNSAYAARAGMPIEAVVGKPYWQVFPKRSKAPRFDAEGANNEASEGGEEISTAAGEIFLTRDITAHRSSGEFWYSRHSFENITLRKRDEELKNRATSFLAAIMDSAPGVFAVVDRGGKLVHWNAGLNARTGRSDAELEEAAALSFVAEADRKQVALKIEEAFATGSTQGEIRILSRNQGNRDLVFSARRFEVEGTPYVVCFCIDTTEVKQLENELIREKAISDTIIESAPGAFFMIDEPGNLVRWNRFLRDETGLSDEQLRGSPILSAIHEADRPQAAAKLLTAFATGYADMEVRVPTRDQGIRHFFKTARRFTIDDVPYVAGFCVDVTQRKETEEALAMEKAFSDALIESAPGAFYVIDRQGNYYRWNSYLNRLTGLSDRELRKRTSLLTIHEDDRPLAAEMMKQAFEAGYAQAELHVLTRDRGVRLYFMTARRFQVADATYLVGVGVDTTDRHARMEELEYEAQTDPLTQIANRGHFMEIAKQELARCKRYGHPVSVWMIDVDNFKSVNDRYGHHGGDVALQSLVVTSRQALRDWDIMGRMGGEEFAVMLPETDGAQALQVAERLRQGVAATAIPIEGGEVVRITVSTGVTTSCGDDSTVETLLARADQALYEAKRTGRDKVCVAGAHSSEPRG